MDLADDVVLVLEGAAHGQDATVVTADRELKRRVRAAGARTVCPSWLRDRL